MWQMADDLVRIGQNGRLVIPARLRRALGIEPGDEVLLRLEEGSLRIVSRTEALRRAQRRVREIVGKGARLSDELIAMRRAERRRG
jgi:AbrB family looped-hinge helix DNA binding protein